MISSRQKVFLCLLSLLSLLLFVGCAGMNVNLGERTTTYYESRGQYWGKKLLKEKKTPDDAIYEDLVTALIDKELDFFNVHSDLKDAFKSGFRIGYSSRVADLVLGPNIRKAAGDIGYKTAKGFVDVINSFEKGWAYNLDHAVKTFIVLLSEGSQADREYFIYKFVGEYKPKFDNSVEVKSKEGYIRQTSDGGTTLFIDVKKTVAVMDIPSPENLKSEIYRQAFRSMGDEWGKRFSTNLIKRNELVELLRRIKPALSEGGNKGDSLQKNMGIVMSAFIESYGSDARSVFESLAMDAGYDPSQLKPVSAAEIPVKNVKTYSSEVALEPVESEKIAEKMAEIQAEKPAEKQVEKRRK